MDTPNHLAPPNWIVGPRAVRVMASWVPWVPRSQVAKIGAADIIVVGLQATILWHGIMILLEIIWKKGENHNGKVVYFPVSKHSGRQLWLVNVKSYFGTFENGARIALVVSTSMQMQYP